MRLTPLPQPLPIVPQPLLRVPLRLMLTLSQRLTVPRVQPRVHPTLPRVPQVPRLRLLLPQQVPQRHRPVRRLRPTVLLLQARVSPLRPRVPPTQLQVLLTLLQAPHLLLPAPQMLVQAKQTQQHMSFPLRSGQQRPLVLLLVVNTLPNIMLPLLPLRHQMLRQAPRLHLLLQPRPPHKLV